MVAVMGVLTVSMVLHWLWLGLCSQFGQAISLIRQNRVPTISQGSAFIGSNLRRLVLLTVILNWYFLAFKDIWCRRWGNKSADIRNDYLIM